MWICGKYFNEDIIGRLREKIQEGLTRSELSRWVCQEFNWRDSRGKFQEGSARKSLLRLERKGLIKLPPPRVVIREGKREWGEEVREEWRGTIEELGRIEVIKVESKAEREKWRELMERYHKYGKRRLCGGQVKYIFWSEVVGWFGGAGFQSGAKKLKARDEWIGWSRGARQENNGYVIYQARFLIVPWVRVMGLGSYMMGEVLRRIRGDWKEAYGVEPEVVETYVDERTHRGTIYRATNWERIGETAGRKDGFENGRVSDGKKAIYVYVWREDFRERLKREPKRGLKEKRPDVEGEGWIKEVVGHLWVTDRRLVKRFEKILEAFYYHCGSSIPEACMGEWKDVKATYEFLRNEEVTMERVLRAGAGAMMKEWEKAGVVLVIQDQTSMNYGTSESIREVCGPVGAKWASSNGLRVHDCLAVTEEGVPLGVVGAWAWKRDRDETGEERKRRRARMDIEEKESYYWLQGYRAALEAVREDEGHRPCIVVGDRDSDVLELWLEYERHQEPKPYLLVRANPSRYRRTVEGESVFDAVEGAPEEQTCTKVVEVRRDGRMEEVELEVKYRCVEIAYQVKRKGRGQERRKIVKGHVRVWLVQAREVHPPPHVEEPLHWVLMTTYPVKDVLTASRVVDWYAKRWMIEVFHKILKTACRAEIQRLRRAESLEVALALDMIIAARIYRMTTLGRQTPSLPCDAVFSDKEWKVLWMVRFKKDLPSSPPPLYPMVMELARVGGHLSKKKFPGPFTLWKGLIALGHYIEAYEAFLHFQGRSPPL